MNTLIKFSSLLLLGAKLLHCSPVEYDFSQYWTDDRFFGSASAAIIAPDFVQQTETLYCTGCGSVFGMGISPLLSVIGVRFLVVSPSRISVTLVTSDSSNPGAQSYFGGGTFTGFSLRSNGSYSVAGGPFGAMQPGEEYLTVKAAAAPAVKTAALFRATADPVDTPEPATLFLSGAALLVIGWVRFRTGAV